MKWFIFLSFQFPIFCIYVHLLPEGFVVARWKVVCWLLVLCCLILFVLPSRPRFTCPIIKVVWISHRRSHQYWSAAPSVSSCLPNFWNIKLDLLGGAWIVESVLFLVMLVRQKWNGFGWRPGNVPRFLSSYAFLNVLWIPLWRPTKFGKVHWFSLNTLIVNSSFMIAF